MRLFEILDKLNVADTENKSHKVALFPDVTNIQCGKTNGHVTVGVPVEACQPLANDAAFGSRKLKAVLMIIDMEAYNEILKTETI